MISALIFSVLISQKEVTPSYIVPAGASTEYHQRVLEIERALTAKNFVLAKKKSLLLPRGQIRYRIDTKKLTSAQSEDYLSAVDFAFSKWKLALGDRVTFLPTKTGAVDILIGFEPVLAKLPDRELVAGATWFFASDSSQPRIEAVLGTKRENPLRPSLGREIHNEALYTIGAYLGLAKGDISGSAMGRVDTGMAGLFSISAKEATTSRELLDLSNRFRIAADKKIVVRPQEPSLFIEDTKLDFGRTLQGELVTRELTVANRGTGILRLSATGDCGCLSANVIAILKPGQTATVAGRYSTDEVLGDVLHNIVLTTNDPERPSIKIPSKIFVSPRAEFLFPESSTAVLNENSKSFVFYMNAADPTSRTDVLDAQLIGINAPMTCVPFEGTVKDFASQKSEKIRGYKLTIDTSNLGKVATYGRLLGTVYLKTSNPKLPVARTSVFFQKGILVMPESVFLGAPSGPLDTKFAISRPGKPFKILSIESDSKRLTFKYIPKLNGSEYVITVIYDGKAPEHVVDAQIMIRTDDPQQGVLKVPVTSSGA